MASSGVFFLPFKSVMVNIPLRVQVVESVSLTRFTIHLRILTTPSESRYKLLPTYIMVQLGHRRSLCCLGYYNPRSLNVHPTQFPQKMRECII